MSQFVRFERKSNSCSSIGFRSITNRRSMPSSPNITQSHINSNENVNNEKQLEEPPTEPYQPAKLFKFKKSELLPPDPTAPVFVQFSKIVKKASNIILRGIGNNRKELKPILNDAFDMFYKDFDSWWKNQKRISQRKDLTNLDIGILKTQLNKCNLSIKPLRDQCHQWKIYKGYLDISVPHFEFRQIEIPHIEKDNEMEHELRGFTNGLVLLSKGVQQIKNKRDNANESIGEVRKILQFELEIDYTKQMSLRERLCEDVPK